MSLYHVNIFYKDFLSHRFNNVNVEDCDVIEEPNDGDGEEFCGNADPASPGMEHTIRELAEANKRLPEELKWNKACEKGRLCAEYMKRCPTQMFELYLNCFENFANFLRDGMPFEVVDFLSDPKKYKNHPSMFQQSLLQKYLMKWFLFKLFPTTITTIKDLSLSYQRFLKFQILRKHQFSWIA